MKRDEKFMREALRLAEKGRGFVEPNPLVGAVIVKQGKVIGRGYHREFGGKHAEVVALESCANPKGATMYVTLEPCAHHGKTPPCTDAIIKAGIARVVAACRDQAPHVRGKGFAKLRRAGIEVDAGVLEDEALALNAPFFKLIATGIPYVTVKWAMTLDGKIATVTGDSAWISNEKSRQQVHKLRANMDAIVVGVNTVVRDDPLLTVRHARLKRAPVRIVLDYAARTPLTSSLVQTSSSVGTMIVCAPDALRKRVNALEEAGCAVLKIEPRRGRLIDVKKLFEFLGKRHFTNLLVEGGGEVIASAFEDRLVDRVFAFVAPKIIGGRDAISPVEGVGIEEMPRAISLRDVKVHRIDTDLLIEGLVQYPD
jgi:diaminohydroxyphosphoribosylaminopyrimidine deaminase/5-amino-6-(5-phosphoribosylamino)uracil reductase